LNFSEQYHIKGVLTNVLWTMERTMSRKYDIVCSLSDKLWFNQNMINQGLSEKLNTVKPVLGNIKSDFSREVTS
jgi:hypothetical protein